MAFLAAAFTHTRGWAALLFPAGVRLSTWVALFIFVALAVFRRNGRPLLAGVAWFLGFEGAYQACALLTGEGLPALGHYAQFMVGVGVVAVVVASLRRVYPSWRIMSAVAVVWAAWVAIGFPANGPTLVGLDPLPEALNEAAKTLWALAYLAPLLAAAPLRARSRGDADLRSPAPQAPAPPILETGPGGSDRR